MSEPKTKLSNLKLFLFVVFVAFVAAFASAFSQQLLTGRSRVWLTVIIVLAVVFAVTQIGWRRNRVT